MNHPSTFISPVSKVVQSSVISTGITVETIILAVIALAVIAIAVILLVKAQKSKNKLQAKIAELNNKINSLKAQPQNHDTIIKIAKHSKKLDKLVKKGSNK